jgi:blocked-early-in-transport protein 1
MSEAYERERYTPLLFLHPKSANWLISARQNNDSLASLQAKVSQLRSVTVDIYDNARDQHVIDNTSESFSNMTTSIKGSARRLGVMASQGNKIAVFKLAGIIIATVVVLWWILSWFWWED